MKNWRIANIVINLDGRNIHAFLVFEYVGL